jgi:excisionase family DNA binding protein
MTERLLLTVTEAADWLALSRSKTYELIAAGDIRSVTVGRSRRVPVDALKRFVEDLTADNQTSC